MKTNNNFDKNIDTLSIVIPTLNEEKYLPQLLEDIKKQSLQPVKIIVSDANSKDKTRLIATSYGAVVVDGGLPGVGRNNGAKVVDTEYILFIDADVELKNKYFLEKSLKNFEKFNLDAANFKFGMIGIPHIDLIYISWNIMQYISLKIFKKPFASGIILIKRHVFEENKGFDETIKLNEDYEFIKRIYKKGYKFAILPQKIYPSPRRYLKAGVLSVFLMYFIGTLLTFKALHKFFNKIYPKLIKKGGNFGEWNEKPKK